MTLYFLDDVFLLHLAFKATKRIFEGFSLLKSDFCQTDYTPKLVQKDRTVIARLHDQVKRNVKILTGAQMARSLLPRGPGVLERLCVRRALCEFVDWAVLRLADTSS